MSSTTPAQMTVFSGDASREPAAEIHLIHIHIDYTRSAEVSDYFSDDSFTTTLDVSGFAPEGLKVRKLLRVRSM